MGGKDASRRWRVVTLLGVAAFAAFRLAELTRYSLWYDEIFSLTLAQMDWGDLFRAAVADRTNPPLFYALLKVWIGIGGNSVAWIRLLPCALGIAAAVPLAALARRVFEPLDGIMAAAGPADAVLPAAAPAGLRPLVATTTTLATAAASPLLVLLSNELRAYSLLLLLTAGSLLAFARVGEACAWLAPGAADGEAPSWLGQARGEFRRRLLILAAVNTVLVYTHYFGWLVIGAEVGAALIWRRGALRGVVLGALATGAAFAPWMLSVLASTRGAPQPLSNVSWISVPSIWAIPGFYDSLVARVLTIPLAWIGLILMGVPVLWLMMSSVTDLNAGPATSRLRAGVAELVWFAVFPVLVIFGLSAATGRSAFVPRYLVVAAPAWWMLVGLAMTRLPGLKESAARLSAVAGVWCAFTLAAGSLRMVRGNEKIPWNDVVAAIAADAGGGPGTVYSLEGFTALPLAYYSHALGAPLTIQPGRRKAADGRPSWAVVRYEPGTDSAPAFAALRALGPEPTPLFTARIPSQVVTAYRLVAR